MLSLSNQKVHALRQQQIVLKYHKSRMSKGDLLGVYIMKCKVLD